MRWIKLALYIFIIYYATRQYVYLSSAKQTNPHSNEIRRVQTFLGKYQSPLQENAKDFVMAAKTYKVPAELLVAISGVESGFGKHNPDCATYNPFGYSSSTSPCGWWRFTDYKQAIYKVAQTISTDRAYQGYQRTRSILELAKIYNPVDPETEAQNIEWFMQRI